MKTAISIPDELFREIDVRSRRFKVSRSRFFADAARQYLIRRRPPVDATAAWNRVVDEAGQPGDDRAAVALRKRSKAAIRTGLARRIARRAGKYNFYGCGRPSTAPADGK